MTFFQNVPDMITFMVNDDITKLTIFVMASIWAKSKFYKSTASLPNLITSIGVLGTFLGIVNGLWNFDVTNIQQSVPSLIEGLKSSFFTSIIGICISVFLKF